MSWSKNATFLVAFIPAVALAQVQIEVTAPSFHWAEAPHMVVVTPGVQVVEDYDQEVFFVDGFYWSRSGDRWYRSQDHNGNWMVVSAPPARLVTYRPGQFRHYRGKRVVVEAPRPTPVRVVVPAPRPTRQGPGHSNGRGRGHGKH